MKVSYPHASKRIMVFTAGCPGSGKTYCLHKVYGLQNVLMLDLDEEMKRHPAYDDLQPSKVYEDKLAYSWANEQMEKRFQNLLHEVAVGSDVAQQIVCFDGTG